MCYHPSLLLGVNPSIIINSRMTYYDENVTLPGILLKVNKGQASSCRYYFYCMVPYFELPDISASNKRWHWKSINTAP